MVNLTKFAVRRPVTIILCLITIAYFGIQSLLGTKVELTPEMDLPMLVIGTVYAGASPEDINDLITTKQEDAISSLDSVDTINSYSKDNVSILLVKYKYGTNIDTAYINLKKAIDGIRNDMPKNIEEPRILELNLTSGAAVTLAVSGNVGQNLYTYVDNKIVPEFEKLSSVSEVSVSGGQKSYVSVQLDPEKMKQYHLNMQTVAQIVGAADFTIPAGDIDVGRQKLNVSAGNDYDNTDSLKKIAIPLDNGDTIHLSDIAEVYDALEEEESIGRYNGENIISLDIKKQSDSTAIDVSKQVSEQIASTLAVNPGIQITVVNDSSDVIRESISNVVQTMIMAIILSMIILWLFYGDLRASVIVGTSIPISVVLSLICMSAMGFSLNVISLTSLVLGVGMMVDNSINVLDGCFRAKETRNYYDAAIEGSRIMIGSITGGTITTCVVFLPLVFLTGMSGQLFRQLGYTIVFCMVASLFSAVTIVPLSFVHWHPAEKEKAPVNGLIKSLQNFYRKHMPYVITKTKLVFTVSILLLAIAFGMASKLRVDLMTTVDEGIVSMTIKMKPGLSIDAMNQSLAGMEEFVTKDENVDHYLVTYGSGGLSIDSTAITLNAYLKDDRKQTTDQVIDKWRVQLTDFKDSSVTLKEGSSTMSSTMKSGDEIEVDLQSTNYETLKKASSELVTELRKRKDVMQVHSSVENAAPVIKVRIDPVKAQAEGLTPAVIGSNVYSALSGVKSSTIRVDGEDIDVKIEYAPDKYDAIEELQGMMITTAAGTTLPLSDLADIYYKDSPQQIERKNKQYKVAITMQPQSEYLKTAKNDVKKFVKDWKLPAGVKPMTNDLDKIINEELGALGRALFTGVFLVFIVMAIQFESPKYSAMVMTSIPFSLIGSFGLLFSAGAPIDMVSMLGFLMLVGTVVNNGILYVETVNQMIEEMSLDRALVEAGAIRMRPIFMTTLTTIISMVPNALAYGKSGKMMQGLALVNVGGLLASTALILLLLPAFYRFVYRLGRKKIGGEGDLICD
ncbi:efflux RND transporter permease subunit [Clostridium boliviensis]|uniref:Efflux RND transporter permease subunit n=1 Tax=Clostridium boliviensis TaxID=318465 RepID=A0ABU4GNM2_9CLOT|nr:efflux RND transporter permease subunit [Clostridium boliviensis]MDW2798538.1 efflux RND transporter permease subunit [Clostridium boliviensis]